MRYFLYTRGVYLYYLFFACLGLLGVAGDFFISGYQHPLNFFSYFTILCNSALVILFFYLGLRIKSKKILTHFLESLRGALIVYLLLVMIVYAVLLESTDTTSIWWISIILHKIMPLATLTSWLLFPPKHKLTVVQSFIWLLFPILYIIYTFIRGIVVNWYPYQFINPQINGYGKVFLTAFVIILFAWIISLGILWLGNFLRKRKSRNV